MIPSYTLGLTVLAVLESVYRKTVQALIPIVSLYVITSVLNCTY